ASNDITLTDPLTVNNPSGAGGALSLQAGRSILLNANLTTDNGALSLLANQRLAAGVVDSQRDVGAALIRMASGTSINAGSGSVTLDLADGAGKTNRTSGVISLTTLSAGSLKVINGVLALGTKQVTLNCGSVSFGSASTLQVTLNGSASGQYGRLVVNGGM